MKQVNLTEHLLGTHYSAGHRLQSLLRDGIRKDSNQYLRWENGLGQGQNKISRRQVSSIT